MTPVLLLPWALAALAALVLAIVIHIARRSEQQPIEFAALRWLSERPRPRARLRLDELLLLAVRLLLLTLLALFLARPALSGLSAEKAFVAIIPGAAADRAGLDPAALDTAHWLARGFPRQRDGDVAASQPIGSLLRELDAERPAGEPLTIVAPATLQSADGERPRLTRAVRWIVTPGAMAERQAPATPPLAVAVRHDPAHAEAARYLRAALNALKPDRDEPNGLEPDIAGSDTPLPQAPRPVIWLAGGALPAAVTGMIRRGGTGLVAADTSLPDGAGPAISLWADATGATLVEAQALGAGRLLRFARRLRPSDLPALLEPDFPLQLQRLLQPAPPPPARADARTYAPLMAGSRSYAPPVTELRPWLALAIAALFLLERWLATRRARGGAP